MQITCNQSFSFVDYIQIYSSQKLILDNSLNLTELSLTGNKKHINIYLYNLAGINIRTETFRFLESEKTDFYLFYDYSEFDLFLDGKIFSENDCKNLISKNDYKKNFFNHIKRLDLGYDVDFGRNKLCPYLFHYSQLISLTVFSHTNSFIKKNMFNFLEINETLGEKIHLNEFRYFFIYMKFDTLNDKIINKYVFKKIEQIRVYGYVLNIQYDLFKNLNNVNAIIINTLKIRTLFHNGNDWLGFIRYSYKSISLNAKRNEPELLLILANRYVPDTLTDLYGYPDEDFCLFSQFPHDKLVYPLIQPGDNALINCSCTLLYLIKDTYSFVYIDNIIEQIISSGEFVNIANFYCKQDLLKKHACNFSTRLSKCNKSNFSLNTDYSFDLALNINIEFLFNLLEFIIIVTLNPFLSFFGIITNLMVLYVVKNIKNLKKDKIKESNKAKDNMFKHIATHSGFNILFCSISILKLINECTTSNLFCSSVFKSSEAQWFDIIVIEFIGGMIKFSCNVSYIFITITRLVIMNKKMTSFKKILQKISNIRIWIYLIFLLMCGVLLNAYKFFHYKIDSLFLDVNIMRTNKNFPTDESNYFSCNNQDTVMCDFFKTLKLINSFINNIILFLLTILFDVLLIKSLSELIEKKKTMVENFKETEEEKLFKICFMDFKCDKINEFTQVFLFISINSQLLINKNFNKVFNESYRDIISKLKSKFSIFKSSQADQVKANASR